MTATRAQQAGRGSVPAAAPWDVPVRLVDPPAGARRVHRVSPGVALPGVVAVDVSVATPDPTSDDDGVSVLVAIDPFRGDAPQVDTVDDAGGDLGELLARLRADGDEAVRVAVAGTPFTRAVLTALVDIPAGSRMTYGELAASAGRPRAVRAAASVMARNRVPLVLPCHRIVPASGDVGHYGWGADVKRALLAAEATP